VIHDLNFEHNPKDLPILARLYLKYFFPKFANKAAKLITVSHYSKKDIIQSYKVKEDKIEVAWNGASDLFKPLNELDKIRIKEKYTDGKSYFLFVGALHPRKNIRRLLEAYSKYKETVNSTYEMVIVGESLWKNSTIEIHLSESVKNSVHFTGHLPLTELAELMGAASIFTFIPYFEGFGIPLVEAMRCGTPIVSGNLTSLPEVAGDAAVYCDPFNVEDIFDKMNELSNNQDLQIILSQKGLERSKLFSWDISAEIVWKEIMKLM
jgi:glycosyltransferase involved in cell wall biosynthesis